MDWISIEVEYISTGASLRGLAEKHGMSLSALRNQSVKRGWVAKRDKYRNKTAMEVLQKTAEEKVDTGAKCAEMMREAFEHLSRAILRLAQSYASSESTNTSDLMSISRSIALQLENYDKLFGSSENRRVIIEVGPKLKELLG